jgi:hypothetical protein
MHTHELIQATSVIASGMIAVQESKGPMDPGTMDRIVQTAIQMVLKIEEAARRAYSGRSP